MIKIYHNPRCRKSREGLQVVQENTDNPEIILYLENPPGEQEIKDILSKLAVSPIELVRKGEAIWKEKYKGKDLTDKEIITAMAQNPKLMERPVVINGEKAVIGRPPEKINDLFNA